MAIANLFLKTLGYVSIAIGVGCMTSAVADEKKTEAKITFDDHIKPIFREHCTTCHSENDKESDLALDSYAATLEGGSSGEVLAAGDSSGSRIVALIAHTEGPFMPPDEDPIAAEKIQLLKTWIDQGMPENSGSKIKRSSSAASAMLTSVSLGKPDGPPPMPQSVLKQPVTLTPRGSAIAAMAASPWSPLLAIGGQEQVVLYHGETAELLGIIPFPEGEPQSLTFTRDGRQLLIGGGRHSKSGCAVLVDIESGKRITKVGDELDTVLAADISPDKTRIALAGPQKVVRIFDSLTGEIVQELKKHTDWVFCLRYSPDGVLLASGDRSNGLVVWEADTGLIYSELKGHTGAIRALDFRADSNVLASAALDGTLRTWDMLGAKQIKSWSAHSGGATAVSFSQDGRIASAGRDRRVKLWNVSGALQAEFKGLSEAVLEVAITGDAKQIAGGDWNGQVGVWQIDAPDKLQPLAPNPPSIIQRLERATQAAQKLQGPFTAAKASQDQSQTQLLESRQALLGFQQAAKLRSQELAAAEAKQVELSQQTTQATTRVTELEELLAAAKLKQAASLTQSKAHQTRLADARTQAVQAKQTLDKKLARHTALTQAAETAEQAFSEAQAQFQAAQTQLEQAEADKALLEQREAELLSRTQAAEAQSQDIAQKLGEQQKVLDKQQASQAAAETQLKALEKQIAELKAKLAQATETKTTTSTQISGRQKVAAELQEQLEKAEQTAAESAEELELFRSAYQKTPQ